MSLIQTPWASQPQQAVGIDWSNPITRGLWFAVNGAMGDLARRSPITNVGAGSVISVGASGVGRYGANSSSGQTISCGSLGTGYSLLALIQRSQVPNGTEAWIDDDDGSTRAFQFRGENNAGGSATRVSFIPFTSGNTPVTVQTGFVSSDLICGVASVSSSGAISAGVNGVVVSGSLGAAPRGTDASLSLYNRKAGGINATKPVYLAVGWARVLSDAEIRSISANPWQIFKPIPRRIFVPVPAAGGGVTITGNIGDATAAGLTASISQAASIAAGVGNSVAAGSQASIAQQYTLSAGIGNATAAGLTATITASGLTTISCTTGDAAAAGSQAVVNSAATVTCSVGNAAAAGLTAALDTAFTILANVGNATADGLSATIQAATGISCGVANAIAAGLTASITNNAPLTDSEKIDLILDILSNRQTLDPVTGVYTLYADDGVTVLKTAQAWEDAAGTIPYRGRALQRLDGMV